jgi:lipopolysaccharide transport system permease protein
MDSRISINARYKWLHQRDLLRELVMRDMKLRYKRSVFGIAWSLLNPLAQLIVFHLIFQLVLPLNIPNYAPFLFTGLLAWNWFQTSLYAATGSVVDNRDLIKRPGFPVLILPVVSVITNFIHYLLALPVLIAFLLIGGIRLTGSVVFLPILFAIQFVLTLGIAYLLAAVHVRFRDTQYLLSVVLFLGFYLSPIFYEASIVPERYQFLYNLNPMVTLIESYRDIFLFSRMPDPGWLLVLCLFAIIILGFGHFVYKHAAVRFSEEL